MSKAIVRGALKPRASDLLQGISSASTLSDRLAVLRALNKSSGFQKSSGVFSSFVDETLVLNPPILDTLDAFASLGHGEGASKLQPRLLSFLSSASLADTCLLAFLCGNLGLEDVELHDHMYRKFRTSGAKKSAKHVARFFHGFRCTEISEERKTEMRSEISSVLSVSKAVDLVMLNRACMRLEISDLQPAIQAALTGLSEEKLPAQAVVSLFEFSKFPIDSAFSEYLAEQSRRLHEDKSFNDLGCLVVARKCAETAWKDPRVLFQVVHFVNTRTLRRTALLPMVEAFARLKIPEDKPWRKFVARVEQVGPELSSAEIQRFESLLRRARKLDDRSAGILALLRDVKSDFHLFGPA